VTARDTRTDEAAERLALVVHELRAPLTVIRGYLQLLERPRDDNELAAARAAAGRASERLEMLLDDLMAAISRPEVFAPATLTHINLHALAEEVVDDLAPLTGHHIEVRGGAGEVAGDRSRLRQALENLVSNAIKHTPDSGDITVTIQDTGTDAMVRITVDDTGPGIGPHDRERVFDLFERLEAGRNAPEGLGLGLPITRAIVSGHGGQVYLEELREGTGARFVVELPAFGSE